MRLCDLNTKHKFLTTEFSFGLDIEFAKELLHLIDAITVPALKKSARTQANFDPKKHCIADAYKLKRAHIEPIVTVTCRDFSKQDENILAELLKNDIKNLLVLYGDKHEEPYETTYHFENTLALIEWIKKSSKQFCFAVACDPNIENIETQLESLVAKERAGASFTITQPIFNLKNAKKLFCRLAEEAPKLRIIAGIAMPHTEAQLNFLKQKLSIMIPEDVEKKLLHAEQAKEFALETAAQLEEYVHGFHVFPIGKKELVADVINVLARNQQH
ncbi:MAG: methylenetetrahydrofolate reductase [Candidatus Diapherotrites archaeon]|nr:methylenetetrahydrofolate reductase [Candidatus Diapherotrites archaeon]